MGLCSVKLHFLLEPKMGMIAKTIQAKLEGIIPEVKESKGTLATIQHPAGTSIISS